MVSICATIRFSKIAKRYILCIVFYTLLLELAHAFVILLPNSLLSASECITSQAAIFSESLEIISLYAAGIVASVTMNAWIIERWMSQESRSSIRDALDKHARLLRIKYSSQWLLISEALSIQRSSILIYATLFAINGAVFNRDDGLWEIGGIVEQLGRDIRTHSIRIVVLSASAAIGMWKKVLAYDEVSGKMEPQDGTEEELVISLWLMERILKPDWASVVEIEQKRAEEGDFETSGSSVNARSSSNLQQEGMV